MKTASSYQLLTIYLSQHWGRPVITRYDLGVLVIRLYSKKRLGELSASGIRKAKADLSDLNRIARALTNRGVISTHKDFSSGLVYSIVGNAKAPSPEILCSVDPFSYGSHLSAMRFHGLTDRIPRTIFSTSPSKPEWRKLARKMEESDLGEDLTHHREENFPKLVKHSVIQLDGSPVHEHFTRHLGGYTLVRESNTRVASIGRTFLDTIRQPELCGGINHVVDVWCEKASTYLKLLIAEIDRNGTQIEKVRAGYLLDEVCNISHEIIEKWAKLAQRGGSRKLDPNAPYEGTSYSERWSISLNT